MIVFSVVSELTIILIKQHFGTMVANLKLIKKVKGFVEMNSNHNKNVYSNTEDTQFLFT